MSMNGYEYDAGGFYGGGPGIQGGGYLQNGADFAGTQDGYGATDAKADRKISRDQKTLLPITIHQALTATEDEPDDHIKIDGHELHQVKIVGQVVEVEETSTTQLYHVDDGTGVITCKLFTGQNDNEYVLEQRAQCQKGVYVRVVGAVKLYQGQRTLNIYGMKPITEGNEITYHMLQAILTHCCNNRGAQAFQKTKPPANVGYQGAAFGGQFGTGGYAQTSGGGAVMAGGFNPMMGGGGGALSDVQSQVLAIFAEDPTESGANLGYVCGQLAQRGISGQQVREAVEFLTNEGHMYTTTDEHHYKVTG